MICKFYNQISFYIILKQPILTPALSSSSLSLTIHPSLDTKYLKKKENY